MALLQRCCKLTPFISKSMKNYHIYNIKNILNGVRGGGYIGVIAARYESTLKFRDHENIITDEEDIPKLEALESKKLDEGAEDKVAKIPLINLINSYDKADTDLSLNSIGLSLLYYCSHFLLDVEPDERRKWINKVWNIINQKLSKPSLEHYHALLRAYIRHSQPINPREFLSDMKTDPNNETYGLVLDCVAKQGDVQSCLYIVMLMKEMEIPLTENTFNALILAYAKSGDVQTVLSNLEAMKNAAIVPTAQTWANVACAYATVGNINEIKTILNLHKLKIEQLMEIVKQLSFSDYGKHIPEILKFVPPMINFGTPEIVNAINDLLYAQKALDAFSLVDHFTTSEVTEKRDMFFESFLQTLVVAKTPKDLLFKIIQDIANVKNYDSAIIDVCGEVLKHENDDLALSVLDLMHEQKVEIRPHYYWPILIRVAKNQGETGVFSVLKHMVSYNVPMNKTTLITYVFPYIATSTEILVIRKLSKIGLDPLITAGSLVHYFLLNNNIKESISIYKEFTSLIDFSKIINPLIKAYVRNPDLTSVIDILKLAPKKTNYPKIFLNGVSEMTLSQSAPSIAELHAVFKEHGIEVINSDMSEKSMMEKKSSKRAKSMDILHPKDMNINELECHLIELKSKGMNTRGLLRLLLMKYCRQTNILRVNELRKEYDENGFLWTPGLYSTLFQFYCKFDKIEEAQELYNELRLYHPTFKIDDVNLINFACVLIKFDSLEEAIRVLESNTSFGGEYVEKHCWKLLNTIIESKHANITEEIMNVLISKGYCRKTNKILGIQVRRHIIQNDISAATKTFVELASQYKCTPSRQELILAIVQSIAKNDSTVDHSKQLLDKVISCSSMIYRREVVKADLIIACALYGMQTELIELLEGYNFPKILMNSLKFVKEEYRSTVLTELYYTKANVGKLLLADISELLLASYSTTGNCQDAVKLWDDLRHRNITPTKNFKKIFVELLNKNNFPLPINVDARK